MNDSLLYAGREQRKMAIPPDALNRLKNLGQGIGDPTFAEKKLDEALTIRWLSKRTGRGEREIESLLPSVMSNYFGKEQIDASQAYDLIVATEAANAQGGGLKMGAPLPWNNKQEEATDKPKAERDTEKYPGWQVPRALGSGFQEFALQIPQGGFSAAAALFADSMPELDDGRTDEDFVKAGRLAYDANQEAEAIKRLTGIDTGPSDEGKAALSAFDAMQAEKNTANKAALDKWRADNADSPLRQTAEFWRELADATDERWGVDPVFANSTFGQFVKATGSMPATSALMALGGVGLMGVGGATFAGVENDRMAYEGEDYDARAALMSNFINAGGQTVLEKVIRLDGVLEKALKTTARSGGKVVMSEFMRNIAKTAVGEGVEEMAQGQWDDMVATIAYDEKRGAIPFVDEGVAGRRFYEFMAGAAGGALMAGTFGGVMTLDQNRNARKAGEYLTTRNGSLLNEYDFKAYRAAYTDAQLADMKDGETLLKAANGDKQAQSEYNKAAAAEAFVSTDGMVDGEGNRLGSVDGKPAVFRADGAIVVVDTANPEAMRAFSELQAALVARKAEVDAYQAERANVINDLVDYITRLQTERGGSFTIEKGAKPKRLVDLKGEAGAKALYEQYVKAGKLPAGLDVNTLMIAGESLTRWDEKLRVWHTAIRISEGASPLAVIEESTEDHFKRLLETGEVTEDQVAGWREAVEQKTDKLEREGVIEWLSNYAVAYATGKAQEGDSRLPESFRRFLERFAAFVRESLELGRKLMQMERDGSLPMDFLQVLQDSTGTAPEKTQGARQFVPMGSELDAEQLAQIEASDTFPKIAKDGERFTVTSPDGDPLATRDTVEDAMDAAMTWYLLREQAAERAAANDQPGRQASDELQRVIIANGGLLAASAGDWVGELKAIGENMNAGQRMRLFRKDALGLDALREAVNEEGFTFETINDLLVAVDESTRGKPVYPKGGGMTFSLSRATPADASNVVELPDGAKMVGPTTFSLAYREMSPYAALEFIDPNLSSDMTMKEVFLSSTPDLATGQGDNKGVRVEFDMSRLNARKATSKPGMAFSAAVGGGEEFVARLNDQDAYRDAVKAFEFTKEALKMPQGRVLAMIAKRLEGAGWVKSERDGVTRMERKAQGGGQTSSLSPEAVKNLPDWAREEMQRQGLNPNRKFNDADLENQSLQDALRYETPEALAKEGIVEKDGRFVYERKPVAGDRTFSLTDSKAVDADLVKRLTIEQPRGVFLEGKGMKKAERNQIIDKVRSGDRSEYGRFVAYVWPAESGYMTKPSEGAVKAKQDIILDLVSLSKSEGWNYGKTGSTTRDAIVYFDMPTGQASFHANVGVYLHWFKEMPEYTDSWSGIQGETALALHRQFNDGVKESVGVTIAQASEPPDMTFSLAQTETPAFKAWFGNSKVVDAQGKPLVVYHGTRGVTEESGFAFDYARIGQQGRAEGAGFYFTTDKNVAAGYSEGGLNMQVFLSIKKPMDYAMPSFKKGILTKLVLRVAQLEAERDGADIGDGFLANYGDVRYEGEASVVRSAVESLSGDEKALDQISGIVGSGVSAEIVNAAVRDVTGYDGVKAKGFENRGDETNTIWVAFFPEQVKSATANKGTFDPANPDITMSLEPDTLPAFGNQSRINELMAVLEKHGDLYINAKGQAELVRMRTEGYQQAIDGAQLAERQRRKTGGLVSVIALPIDYRIERISPEIFRLLRDRTFQADTKATDDNRIIGAMYLKAKAMGETNLALLDHALANGHADVADTLAKSYGFTSELNAARAVFEAQMNEALELGVPLGKFFVRENELEGESLTAFRQAIKEAQKLPAGQAGARMAAIALESGFKRGVENYWPRRVMDRDGLLKSMGLAGIQEPFQKLLDKAEAKASAAGRALTEREIDALVDAANAAAARARFQGSKKPGALKARVFETVTAEQLKFYFKGIDAAFMHNTAMRNYLETLRFFGKSVVFSEGDVVGGFAEIPINVPQSVGAWITDATLAGKMNEAQVKEVTGILVDRFNYRVSGSWVQGFRMFSYLQNMTQITSGITANLAETWQGFYDSGSNPFRYGKNFVKAMRGLSKISLADIGQDPRNVAQEFDAIEGVDPKLKDALRGLFTQPVMNMQRLFQWFSKRIGMQYFSRVMKETHVNGAVDYLMAAAQSDSLTRKQREGLVRIFGEAKASQVLADMRGGNVTDDVRFYGFNMMANWQPISLDQMPQGYLANPYGRVFYMYKTWMSAQFAGLSRAAGEDIASGDAKRVASGVSTFLYLALLMVGAGIPVDLIVAMIQGRGFILSDSAANRLLGMLGMSQYTAKSLKQRQWGDFLTSYFLPPAGGAASDVVDDARAVYYAGDEIDPLKLRTWRNLPVFGRVYNGYIGHSADAYAEKIEAAGGRIVLRAPDEQTKSEEELYEANRKRILKQYSSE